MPRAPVSTFDRAVRLLAARRRSEAELRGALEHQGAPAGEIADAIARVKHLAYLDDRTLAEDRARKLLAQGYAVDLAAQKLAATGFDEPDASAAVRGAAEGATSEELCRRALEVRRKGRNLLTLEGAARRRLARALVARGHDPQIVARLLGVAPRDREAEARE